MVHSIHQYKVYIFINFKISISSIFFISNITVNLKQEDKYRV